MPTVSVPRDELFVCLNKTYSKSQFEDLCFEFGIELEEETSEREQFLKERGDETPSESELAKYSDEKIYKIEVPANRYDLLCLEGLATALNVFLGHRQPPVFKAIKPAQYQVMNVAPETAQIRPFVVCAILRNITFTARSFDSFIKLQEKLHQNICRKRTLVAIGTHDLDKIKGPFSYEALPPSMINFVPLKQTKSFRADELLQHYEQNDPSHIGKYVPIIKDSPVYPVIYDANRVVLSLPPIINGEHSKMTEATRNVFIECTATDLTKAKIVLNTMVTMFAQYCAEPFTVEEVQVNSPSGSAVYPDLSLVSLKTTAKYVNSFIGTNLSAEEVAHLLAKMQLTATATDGDNIDVLVPPVRSDVLHECDIMEDAAIAYGFNNIKRTMPKTVTVGKQLPLNKVSDMLRQELAVAGYIEILTLALVSKDENFRFLRKEEDGSAVVLDNPQTEEFQVARTSLIPSILKTLAANKAYAKPIQIFEVNQIVLIDDSKDVGARNERRMAALYCSSTPGLEHIHGLLDRVMHKFEIPMGAKGYTIAPSNDRTFFEGFQAEIFLRGKRIGIMGVVHPEVLEHFGIDDVCSILEINVEALL